MKENDVVYIRNSAGKLKITLNKKLNTRSITIGSGEDALPTLEHPRMEFHKQFGDIKMITLYDNKQDEPTKDNPNTIYVAFMDFGEVEIWRAFFDNEEEAEDIYETVE